MCVLAVLAGLALCIPSSTWATPVEGATDVDRPSDYSFDVATYCEQDVLLSDVVKDIGHSAQLEAIDLTAGLISDEEEQAIGEFFFSMVKDELGNDMDRDPQMVAYLHTLRDDALALKIHCLLYTSDAPPIRSD